MTIARETVGLAAVALGLASTPVSSYSQQGVPEGMHELAEGVQVEVIELKRVSGDLVHLGFAITNQSGEDVSPGTFGVLRGGRSEGNLWACGVLLLDLTNLKRHVAGNCSSAPDLGIPAGTRREFWAQYQAPPADVTNMTVQVPDAAPFYDVPLAGGS